MTRDDRAPDLRHVRDWVFDLDNTLYPSECDLFSQVDARMARFVAEYLQVDAVEARRIQKQYYAEHGTTLNGLMQRHGLKPDAFLDFVHDIDLSVLDPAPELAQAIDALPGRKFVFTNGSMGHAERVLAKLNIRHVFDDVFDIAASGFRPKPQRAAFDRMVEEFDIQPATSAMVEDLARNLQTAHALGFTTVLVQTRKDWSHEPKDARPAAPEDRHDHVHFATENLTVFLKSADFFKPVDNQI
ncbi:MAG: pyrimidine 5'-nucleotidase [Maricaulaceae bacterium]